MIQQWEEEITGVVCLHCRMQTPVSKTLEREQSGRSSTKLPPRISIVRCEKCGGEAPYLANELILMKVISSPGLFAA
jgi:translation initiation factor 2 beta subunit (eIF-2beta)/eIF-5